MMVNCRRKAVNPGIWVGVPKYNSAIPIALVVITSCHFPEEIKAYWTAIKIKKAHNSMNCVL